MHDPSPGGAAVFVMRCLRSSKLALRVRMAECPRSVPSQHPALEQQVVLLTEFVEWRGASSGTCTTDSRQTLRTGCRELDSTHRAVPLHTCFRPFIPYFRCHCYTTWICDLSPAAEGTGTSLTPKKCENPGSPSTSWEDYIVPTELPADLQAKVASVRDLVTEVG